MKKKNKRRLTALAISLLAATYAPSAFAASLSVKIKQIDHAGATGSVICALKKACVLPVDIQNGGQKETLKVHIFIFVPGNVMFEFETPKGYLYAGEKNPADKRAAIYEAMWHGAKAVAKPSIKNVTLFAPLTPHPEVGLWRTKVEQPFADLEVTTELLP